MTTSFKALLLAIRILVPQPFRSGARFSLFLFVKLYKSVCPIWPLLVPLNLGNSAMKWS